MDYTKVLTLIIQAGSFIAAFAAIAAGVLMSSVTKKFGTGILASGFKNISLGVLFVAIGIIIDAVTSYFQTQISQGGAFVILLIFKEALFVIGTYVIVIGIKKTGDKLESLTK